MKGDTVNVKFEMVSNPGIVGYAYAQAKDCKDAGTVFSITGVLMCIISAALGIYTAKLDKLHLQLIENGTKVKGLVEKVYLQKYTRYRRQIPYRILYSFTYHDKVYYHKSRLVWEKPDLKKGDLITVYVNNLGKSTVYNCNEAV